MRSTGALASLGEGYTLLTTPRASAMAPAVAERAGAVHEVAARGAWTSSPASCSTSSIPAR